jgi:hypothetical protein
MLSGAESTIGIERSGAESMLSGAESRIEIERRGVRSGYLADHLQMQNRIESRADRKNELERSRIESIDLEEQGQNGE